MSSNRDHNERFLQRHADELDELLREAIAVTSAPTAAAVAASPLGGPKQQKSQKQEQQQLQPQQQQQRSVISFSSYDNAQAIHPIANAGADLLSLSSSSSSAAAALGTSSSNATFESGGNLKHHTVRLKPLGEGVGGSSKALKRAEKEERQWYRENVLEPQRRAQEEEAKRIAAEEAAAAEEERRQRAMQPLDPARYTVLPGTRGSLAPDARVGHSTVAFDDKLFVFGGSVVPGNNGAALSATANAPSSSTSAASVTDDFFVCSGLGSVNGVTWGPVTTVSASTATVAAAVKPPARTQHSLVAFKQRPDCDAFLLLFGGSSATGELLNDAWQFMLGEQRWQRVGAPDNRTAASSGSDQPHQPPPSGRCAHSCVVLRNQYAFVFGGRVGRKSDPTSTKACADLFVLDPGQRRWIKMTAPAPPAASTTTTSKAASSSSASSSWPCARYCHAASADPSGERMFIHGGVDSHGDTLADLWSLDYSTRVWREVHGMTAVGVPRSRHGLLALSKDRVMMLGGVSVLSSNSGSSGAAAAAAISSSACLVVVIGSEQQQQDQQQQQKQQRLIVETLLQQPFVGNPQPAATLHSFGTTIAASNGSAFIFSGSDPSALPTNLSAVQQCKGSISRFVLPTTTTATTKENENETDATTTTTTMFFDPKSLFALWCARRMHRDTAPVPHDVELSVAAVTAAAADTSTPPRTTTTTTAVTSPPSPSVASATSSSSSSVFCHKSILSMRAPQLWQAIIDNCSCTTRELGTGGSVHWLSRFDLCNSSNSNSTATVSGRRSNTNTARPGLSDTAPRGFLTQQSLESLVHFLYCGVLPEHESRGIAAAAVAAQSERADMFHAVARIYHIPSLTTYLNALLATSQQQLPSSTTPTTVNVAARRAAAERAGVASLLDDSVSSLSGYATQTDVTLYIKDSHGMGTEKINVHAAVVASASPVLRAALAQHGGVGGVVTTEVQSKRVACVATASAASSSSDAYVERHVTVRGLAMPLGSALTAALEHMYSGKVRGVTIGNAFEVSLVAATLELPFLRAAAERVLLASLSPVLDLPIRELCGSLRLAARYGCGLVAESLTTAAAIRIAELEPAVFTGELPVEIRVDVLQLANTLYAADVEYSALLRELEVELRSDTESMAALAHARGGSATIAKAAAEYEGRALLAGLQTNA